jgi:hypothetical protein
MGTNNVDRAQTLCGIKVHPIPLKLSTNKQLLTRKEKVAKRKEYQQHINNLIINC